MQNVNKQQYQKTDPRWMDNSSNIEAKTRWNQVRKGRNGTKNGWRPSNTVIKLGKNTTVASRRGMLMRRGADGRSWRDQQGAIFQDRMLSLSQEREREREREREPMADKGHRGGGGSCFWPTCDDKKPHRKTPIKWPLVAPVPANEIGK